MEQLQTADFHLSYRLFPFQVQGFLQGLSH